MKQAKKWYLEYYKLMFLFVLLLNILLINRGCKELMKDTFCKRAKENYQMAHKDKIKAFLFENRTDYCDDCISELSNISPRQTVYQICSKLNSEGFIQRGVGLCSYCGKSKTVSSLKKATQSVQRPIDNIRDNILKLIKIRKDKDLESSMVSGVIDKKFIPVELVFGKFNMDNTFADFNAHTLDETLSSSKYVKFKNMCEHKYAGYMNYPLGKFIMYLKINNNDLYKKFLNPYGDNMFCRFKIADYALIKRKGLYMFKYKGNIKYIGRVKGEYDFNKRINWGYAVISPKNCYLDGQATNCHINSIINSLNGNVELYLKEMDDDEQICSLEAQMIRQYQPEWNIALKKYE